MELLETSEEAVLREVQEELGVPAKVLRLLWLVENFWHLEDRRVHEWVSTTCAPFRKVRSNSNPAGASSGIDSTPFHPSIYDLPS